MDSRFEQLSSLLEDYTSRLKNLYQDYYEMRKVNLRKKLGLLTSFTVIASTTIFVTYYFTIEKESQSNFLDVNSVESLFFVMVFALTSAITGVYFYLSQNTGMSQREIFDEMELIRRQLEDIVRRASQTFEHQEETDLERYKIRLKIIEAEDILKKTSRLMESRNSY